ncbi:MAG: diacylglycerol kinase [Candidatus Liptonbacteria bacterium]|nr:diacylglycerol kinase [Candidatus Liptonbacteria bacterium]
MLHNYFMFKKIINSFMNAFRGLRLAYKHDQSFRMEMWASPIIPIFGYFFWPLENYEILFLALSLALIFITELINTAFERALERIHPERHELIRISKDITASAVLIAVIFAGCVFFAIAYRHFFAYLPNSFML